MLRLLFLLFFVGFICGFIKHHVGDRYQFHPCTFSGEIDQSHV